MEVQLDELIQKIKNDGILSAKEESERLIKEAKLRAESLIKDAEDRVRVMNQEAKKKAERDEFQGREALVQAGRDLLLNLLEKITAIFDASLGKAVKNVMKGETLESLIKLVLLSIKDVKTGYIIEVPSKTADNIIKALMVELSKEISEGIEVRPTKAVDAGFRIQEKNGSIMYDFSSQTVAENLAAYVNHKLQEDIKRSANLLT